VTLMAVLVAVAVVLRPGLTGARHTGRTPRAASASSAAHAAPQRTPLGNNGNNDTRSPLPQASGPTAIDGTALPAGWGWPLDPGGFRVAVPRFWTYTKDASMAYFQESGGDRMLSVGTWRPMTSDLVTAWTKEEVDTAKMPGYQRVSIGSVAGFFEACADWEYTYSGAKGESLHVINRAFRTGPSRLYVIIWRTDTFDWAVNQAYFWLIIGSFRETG